MISLFIDTSLSSVSISVIKDDKILSLIEKDIPNMHSIYTTSYLKKALDDANINPLEVDNIYIVNGPGSFTGLRIGVTIAKTYGYLIDKDLTPVSTLKAIAISSDYKGVIMSIIKANKSNYYVGIYDKNYQNVIEEKFTNKSNLMDLVNKYHPYIVTTEDINIDSIQINKINLNILKIINYYQDKEKVNYYALVPNYIKQPQAVEDKKD